MKAPLDEASDGHQNRRGLTLGCLLKIVIFFLWYPVTQSAQILVILVNSRKSQNDKVREIRSYNFYKTHNL